MSDIYLSITETPAVVTLSQPVISGALSSTVTVANTVTVALDANSLSALENVTVTVGAAVSVSNFPASQVVSVSNFPASSSVTIGGFSTSSLPPSTVTVGNSVTIGNFPSTQTIAGTVTANLGLPSQQELENIVEETQIISGKLNSVTIGFLPSISGTVTVGGFSTVSVGSGSILAGGLRGSNIVPITLDNANGDVLAKARLQYYSAPNYVDVGTSSPLPISGTVTVGNSVTIGSLPAISGTVTANLNYIQEGFFGAYDSGSGTAINQNLVAVRGVDAATWLQDGGGNVPISGTVTANNPNGALTTRFGSVVTANLAFITSAVTNTSRKYLLAQNISAGTVTIGIGFSPTTTQGIQLTAGGGLTFDSFCPTGAVYWLGAVTGANYCLIEG